MTEKRIKELKPCPFCGARAYCIATHWGDEDGPETHTYAVFCDDCGISTRGMCDNKDEAIDRWNRRDPSAAVEARNGGIDEMYEESVIVTQAHPGLEPELRMYAERLKEQG